MGTNSVANWPKLKCGDKYLYTFNKGSHQKKTVNFMTICQRVGRWQFQNMISLTKEIMTRGWMPESYKSSWKPLLFIDLTFTFRFLNLFLEHYCFVCLFMTNLSFIQFRVLDCPLFTLKMLKMKLLEPNLIFLYVIITLRWVGA